MLHRLPTKHAITVFLIALFFALLTGCAWIKQLAEELEVEYKKQASSSSVIQQSSNSVKSSSSLKSSSSVSQAKSSSSGEVLRKQQR